MLELINDILQSEESIDFRQFLHQLRQQNQQYLLRNDILTAFSDYCKSQEKSEFFCSTSQLGKLIYFTQEIILDNGNYCLVVRPKIANQQVFHITEDLQVEPMTVEELLDLRDRFVNRFHPHQGNLLELDFHPLYDYSPTIRDPKNIGKGVQFLNRYLSSKLQESQQLQERLFQFLSLHNYNGTQLLINPRIQNQQQLSQQVKLALGFVNQYPATTPYSQLCFELQEMGFEPGWGNTAGRIQESLELLDGLIDSPDHQALENLLSRIPMMFRIVLVSVHGWFGQEGVLGRPDTGGQVVYVLDQARSLEQQLQEDITLAGLDLIHVQPKVIILSRLISNCDGTRCNQRLEKVYGTTNVWILRVPFREFNPNVTQNWISRFEIWPYLETYAIDAEKEVLAEFHGKPDLIVGNYSDGNLVAFLLARRLKVTQCNIAHALEKSKYLFSNLYWQDLEDKYHFSLQFTADLIAMNAANFIISSTYQEIVGTPDSVGQYESYKSFTMPELYHVVDGIELFSPKFNLVPPGVNESYFFPYTDTDRRFHSERDRLENLLFNLEDSNLVYGKLDDPNKRPIFSMARLDRIKNLTGLAECFGKSEELQQHCNLILVAGKLRVEDSSDYEEATEIEKLYRIIDQYNLHGKIRWLGVRLSKNDSGEIYRLIADHQGVFVQPALFEAFGLTVLEAMISGLPTFATQFGGPLEIIQNGVNGFYINPTRLEEMAQVILEFVHKCDKNTEYWLKVSQQSIKRVLTNYTWKIHTTRLLSLARIYGFWNYTSQENREDMLRYLEILFYLVFKPRAQQLLAQHMQR
ncbi:MULTISPECIES: sucrose synthase [unclassified Tolypothrix]|uniref:sucrose synthase n=1 Tax=unclassified Tolypothrix TaxID=2649714 RepID=UPI0005EAA913|nr:MULTISPECIES: sucrose synthase [unclassified Tolypothrix]BAY92720.1 sucrose synthase [Microchaete diplosiphon NIES-3275]EKF05828.1 sucrose synthase [Tolypothrix sp. PCC 7601]MBE9081478.1 sucrose synthase [Tolypothrix sp. LEGE 11397]UYD26649.1 sucrose synthase [Tolypothrix sp. PCC 7712]UYD37492.1 sucrose synthase [Tolypothrix sp. PCC 7601]